MAIMAASHLFRVDAGFARPPRIPFGSRIIANIDPPPQNAFMPRGLPGTIFGPAENIPDGYWIYQGGKTMARVNIKLSGATQK